VTAEQNALLAEIVWVDPDRMSGEPCFKGTRVPVQALIDHIEGNSTLDDFLEGFPSVTREQVIGFEAGETVKPGQLIRVVSPGMRDLR